MATGHKGESKRNGSNRESEVFFPVTKTRFPSGAMVKNPLANAGDKGDAGSILGSGRSPGGGNDNPLQYSCLENSTDRGA